MDFETRKQQILDWLDVPVNRQVLAGLGFGAATLATEDYLVHKGVLTNALK